MIKKKPARKNEGMAELLDAVYDAATAPACRDRVPFGDEGCPNSRTNLTSDDFAVGDVRLSDARLRETQSGDAVPISDHAVEEAYARAEEIVALCVHSSGEAEHTVTDRLDAILTSKRWGIPIMLLLLGMVFSITLYLANYPSQFLSRLFFSFEPHFGRLVLFLGAPDWLHSMLVTGVYRTMAWVTAVLASGLVLTFCWSSRAPNIRLSALLTFHVSCTKAPMLP